ncbi:hypothetical protein TorRG33x02_174020 [Trema orientale]|uniref:Uncharacterized protein n=1 Tax=Trema orientale TaxID=63057 RepID=A0A2P5EMW7_TREOI|nr:hypothetical protein TorRG33x02_174020 [Trema orientale]
MVGVDLDSASSLGPDRESIRTTIRLTKSNQVVGLYAGSLVCIAASEADRRKKMVAHHRVTELETGVMG